MLKDWFSTKSYQNSCKDHWKNFKPYYKETAIGAVLFTAAAVYLSNKCLNEKQVKQMDTVGELLKSNYCPLDMFLLCTTYTGAKEVAWPTAYAALGYTGIRIVYDVSTEVGVKHSLMNSTHDIKNAIYGTKEAIFCLGNGIGYLGALVAVDGIYEYILKPGYASLVGDAVDGE